MRHWLLILAGVQSVAIFVLLLLYQGNDHYGLPRILRVQGALPSASDGLALSQFDATSRFLHITLCNGLGYQKLGLVYGGLLAKRAGRVLVIPQFVRDGAQVDDEPRTAREIGNALDVEDLFDARTLFRSLNDEGIKFTTQDLLRQNFPSGYTTSDVTCNETKPCWRTMMESDIQHAHMTCPFPGAGITREEIDAKWDMVLRLLEAMRPSIFLAGLVAVARRELTQVKTGGDGLSDYNFLHARIEHDWEAHCVRWAPYGDNCLNNTMSLAQQMMEKGMDTTLPLYVGTNWDGLTSQRQMAVIKSLKASGYNLITQVDLLPPRVETLSREAAALVDFEIGMGAHKTIGNSVSVFDALMMMMRWNHGKWASYYNGGFIPLEAFMPLFPMPVVFSYRPSEDLAYSDYMMRALVRSAHEVSRARLFCMFHGEPDADIAWMEANGVTIILHRPAWAAAMTEMAGPAKEMEFISPLYSSSETILATFARIDIPIMEELLEYNYVLYVDIDVFFRRKVDLHAFGDRLPTAIGMAPELNGDFPRNAGVSLWNTLELRKTHQALVDRVLDTPKLWFERSTQIYGPLDQGALNMVYEDEIKAWMLSEDFNAKPYKDAREDAYIVHFHGPKLHDYAKYVASVGAGGYECNFWDLCERGVTSHSVCAYAADYKRWVNGTIAEGFINQLGCDDPKMHKRANGASPVKHPCEHVVKDQARFFSCKDAGKTVDIVIE